MKLKMADILENLTIDEELLAELQSRGVITSEIADNIRCRPVDMDKNRYLCSFIYQQPKPQLDAFVDVLKKSRKQDHVVKFFELDQEKLGKIYLFPRHTHLQSKTGYVIKFIELSSGELGTTVQHYYNPILVIFHIALMSLSVSICSYALRSSGMFHVPLYIEASKYVYYSCIFAKRN